MKTRSHIQTFVFEFDFDKSSTAWKANKKSIGNGSYKYVCQKVCKNGKPCTRPSEIEMTEFVCRIHKDK